MKPPAEDLWSVVKSPFVREMKTDFNCEICRANDWQTIGQETYQQGKESSPYDKKRFKVLFDIWFPGQDQVLLTSLLCRACGFVCYSPRPEKADIDAKYRALAEMGQDYGKSESPEIERQRAERVCKPIKRLLSGKTAEILDYGGGDGRLMAPLAEAGHRCHLVDYNQDPRPFVTKLGDTLDDLEEGRQFDVIVANHVIEHVAEPRQVIAELAGALRSDGTLLVEVPMEIWRKAPLLPEPVTHINFFVRASLRRAMEEAGLSVVSSLLRPYLHPSGRLLPAVQAMGVKPANPDQVSSTGFDEVQSLLEPDLFARLSKVWHLRECLPDMLRARLPKQLRRRG